MIRYGALFLSTACSQAVASVSPYLFRIAGRVGMTAFWALSPGEWLLRESEPRAFCRAQDRGKRPQPDLLPASREREKRR